MNIAEILKDCPKGTKLYSPLLGEVSYIAIDNERIVVTNGAVYKFMTDGRFWDFKDSECLLFPSKDNHDWSAFKAPKKGDFVYRKIGGIEWISIHNHIAGENVYSIFNLTKDGWKGKVLNTVPLCSMCNITQERLATEEEKQELLNVLDENGYVWDEEKLELRKKPTSIC